MNVRFFVLRVLVPLCSLACSPSPSSEDAGRDASDAALDAGTHDAATRDAGALLPTRLRTYTASDAILANPERGFYHSVDLLAEDDVTWATADGTRLLHTYVRLDAWREAELPASLLTDIEAAFDRARAAGAKIVLRFAYNFGPYPDSEPDASLAWVRRHVATLGPLLREHADVIAVLQAGFIGAWGEWHTSTNGLDTPENERAVLDAILAELPAERVVQVRYPEAKHRQYGEPLTEEVAFTAAPAARVGHHNDCFVSSDTDVGTYPPGEVERWKRYLEEETRFVPMGGETCAVFAPRSECTSALAEMERLHFTYVNADYHPDVVASWERDGCRATMERRLGYRLVLVEAELPDRLEPGRAFVARVRLRNEGFAAPMNARPVVLELTSGERRLELPFAGVDPRRWWPGRDVVLEQRVELPEDLPEGPFRFALALRDPSARLAADPRFAIRTANVDTWDDARGVNVLSVGP